MSTARDKLLASINIKGPSAIQHQTGPSATTQGLLTIADAFSDYGKNARAEEELAIERKTLAMRREAASRAVTKEQERVALEGQKDKIAKRFLNIDDRESVDENNAKAKAILKANKKAQAEVDQKNAAGKAAYEKAWGKSDKELDDQIEAQIDFEDEVAYQKSLEKKEYDQTSKVKKKYAAAVESLKNQPLWNTGAIPSLVLDGKASLTASKAPYVPTVSTNNQSILVKGPQPDSGYNPPSVEKPTSSTVKHSSTWKNTDMFDNKSTGTQAQTGIETRAIKNAEKKLKVKASDFDKEVVYPDEYVAIKANLQKEIPILKEGKLKTATQIANEKLAILKEMLNKNEIKGSLALTVGAEISKTQAAGEAAKSKAQRESKELALKVNKDDREERELIAEIGGVGSFGKGKPGAASYSIGEKLFQAVKKTGSTSDVKYVKDFLDNNKVKLDGMNTNDKKSLVAYLEAKYGHEDDWLTWTGWDDIEMPK